MALKHWLARVLLPGPLLTAFIYLRRMPRASFSLCGEDVYLRNLAKLPARGFYVDVGAAHPFLFSNTYALYARGWTGLTIEPNPEMASLQRIVRPRDKQIVEGVADETGELTYFQFDDFYFNTLSPEHCDTARAHGARLLSERKIAVRPLRDILAEHASGKSIDLLCIDCEGYDLAVLKSNDWARWRPAVVVVEDLEGTSEPDSISPIRRFLLDQGYRNHARVGLSVIAKAE